MKYGLIGRNGRMGNEIYNLFSEKGHQLVFSYDKSGEFFEEKPEILIDFSLPEAFNKVIEYVDKFKVPLVIGTTGLDENQIKQLHEISQNIPVVQSYNFSIGIQVLLRLTKLADSLLKDVDIEILETHHRFKKDKPSGTAKMLKDVLNKDVNISSIRVGNVPGDHTVYFGTLGEVITISHRALSRRTFAEGVLKSAEFAIKSIAGFYTFNDVFNLTIN
ncbi:dihydrodipicolinate reductase [Marinitoga sp. 1135]|uniref:4-hydroxy-tetrahydrodipicolinate reductase n=1 Tax=Marinitoga piezophila (strain DSM 14283 / JCM 11233 / KA3) TaxID=443254 RepID=H2J5N7_MARPK|nr:MULTISPECIES: dihydrodipicolinate reductase C-terminal domain-containing protein [Marinitoga]AEX85023.1 dihydrodipicolinate reductase [Marinitoga piezophila KA3]APT75536.1 dihydrodipicolinate reductase [Marinitoga sp. 1137]NUU95247.1 dihydrodipicolinate reductase [Marinitoga sp. 1135]